MANDEIPENIDLRFLARQGKQILAELAEARSERAEMRKETKLIPEIAAEVARLGVQAEDIKAEVLACRSDVAGADVASKKVAVRLTELEKRVKALEEARPDA